MSSNRVPDWLQPGPITPPPLLPATEEIRETCGDGPGAAMMLAYLEQARQVDYSFTCECGWRTADTRYEAHVCPESAGPVCPGEEPTT